MENREKIVVAVMALLVLALGGTAVVFYRKYNDIRKNPQKYVQDTVDDLVKKVRELIVLPDNEVPTVATVVDPAKLKDQPFFAKASVGDKVLIYGNAKKVYLYNPGTNKIVEVAPLSIGNPEGTSPAPNNNNPATPNQ